MAPHAQVMDLINDIVERMSASLEASGVAQAVVTPMQALWQNTMASGQNEQTLLQSSILQTLKLVVEALEERSCGMHSMLLPLLAAKLGCNTAF